MVNGWLAGSPPPTDFITNAFYLQKWHEILKKDSALVDVVPYIDQIAGILITFFSVPQNVATDLAWLAFNNSKVFREIAAPHLGQLPVATQQQVIAAINKVFLDMRVYFEGLEAAHHSLTDLYTAHPQVETTLTIQGLTDSSHKVRWYDDSTGSLIKEEPHTGSTIHIQSPAFTRHIAFIINDG